MTDAELNRMEEIPLHSDVARLVAELRSAQAENERLREALTEETLCQTCEGKKVWHPECPACLCGEGRCTCATVEAETCPHCEGTGRVFEGEKAKQFFPVTSGATEKGSNG